MEELSDWPAIKRVPSLDYICPNFGDFPGNLRESRQQQFLESILHGNGNNWIFSFSGVRMGAGEVDIPKGNAKYNGDLLLHILYELADILLA